MADVVFVDNLKLFGHHGVAPEETRLGQRFALDIRCEFDAAEGAGPDSMEGLVHYGELCDLAAKVSAARSHKLIEGFADAVAAAVLRGFPSVHRVMVRVRKPGAPVAHVFDAVGVEATHERRTQAALAFGANLGDKAANIRAALSLLAAGPRIRLEAVSPFYRTAPWGKTDQDWFVNACALVSTSLSPRGLLRTVKAAERVLGRTPGLRWGPRVIDIDIVDFGGLAMSDAKLTLPHPEAESRAFVMVPLADIAPDLAVAGKRAADWAAALGAEGMERL